LAAASGLINYVSGNIGGAQSKDRLLHRQQRIPPGTVGRGLLSSGMGWFLQADYRRPSIMAPMATRIVTLLMLLGLAACAATPGHVHQGKTVDEINNQSGLALQGYDPVAYFKEGKTSIGDAAITFQWQGATYRFSSLEDRQAFMANPERYAPQFGGYCAFAVSRGTIANGDPHQWAIENDRLFLNNNALAMTLWNQDRPGNIRAGDENWPLLPKRLLPAADQAPERASAPPASGKE
jgi:YHS domain-containing protein